MAVTTLKALEEKTFACLNRRKFSSKEAKVIARDATRSTGEGHLAHGIGALWILDRLGQLAPGRGRIVVRRTRASCVEVSAKGYLGFLPAYYSLNILCGQIRRRALPAMVLVLSKGFRGRLGHLVETIAEQGAVGIVMQSTPFVVDAIDCGRPLLGTNPIAIGVPTPKGEPIIVDFATSNQTYTDNFLRLQEIVGKPSAGPFCKPWGGLRGRALSIGIQAAVECVSGLPLEPQSTWGLLLLALPPCQVRTGHNLALYAEWAKNLGLLPGEVSRCNLSRANAFGIKIPGPIWKWLDS